MTEAEGYVGVRDSGFGIRKQREKSEKRAVRHKQAFPFELPQDKPVIYIENKIDLLSPEPRAPGSRLRKVAEACNPYEEDSNLSEPRTPNPEPRTPNPHSPSPVPVSALTGQNIDALKDAIYQATVGKISAHGAKINNLRQLTAVVKSLEALERLEISKALSLDCMLSDLSDAYRELGSVTGVTATDAIVNEIFSKFCVGK
ncbi:MAG: hypothetical protein FWD58_06720 [Firmicutes bacterium]|nr:hypothetical protein [Bacillota bacterium]